MQNHLYKNNDPSHQRATNSTEKLQMALAEREQFLEHHPHMRAYQAQIDRVLDKSGNHLGRLAVLAMLMQDKLFEIQRELYKLNKIIHYSVSSRYPPGELSAREIRSTKNLAG